MQNVKRVAYIMSIFLVFTGLWAQEKEQSLSLEECIASALENNLGVAVEVLTPRLADITVSQAKERFFPQISARYYTQNTNTPSFSWIDATDQVTTQYNDYSAQITQQIPTGASFSIALFSYENDTNRKFQTINPRYGSTLQFYFTQPLLKNFGLNINRKEIIVARNNRDISESEFKKVLSDTIYNVEEAYWNLVYSIENLRVMEQSLNLARDLLVKNQREVEVGTLAPIEILSAEAEVATREADILQAEALVKNSGDRLRTIINLKAKEKGEGVNIAPVEKPVYTKKDIQIDEALLIAMKNRPDLNSLRLDLKNKDIELGYAKNQLLPDLSVEASYWSPGVSGTQILYLDNNPLTDVVIGTVEGSSRNALKDAFNFRYRNWSVGITLSLPLNTLLSRAEYARARISLDQSKLRMEAQEQQVFLDVRNAVRSVQTDYKRVQGYNKARELAEKKLEAEEKKLKVGLTTNYLVLQYQRDLATTRSSELRAIVDYNLSLARLNNALGITLDEKNIKFSTLSD